MNTPLTPQVGVQRAFAEKLSYPVPVTPWNVEQLRALVVNSPDVYPGTLMVEMEDWKKVRTLKKSIRDDYLV